MDHDTIQPSILLYSRSSTCKYYYLVLCPYPRAAEQLKLVCMVSV